MAKMGFLVKKSLISLNFIYREWLVMRSWLAPHFNRNMHISISVSYNVYIYIYIPTEMTCKNVLKKKIS